MLDGRTKYKAKQFQWMEITLYTRDMNRYAKLEKISIRCRSKSTIRFCIGWCMRSNYPMEFSDFNDGLETRSSISNGKYNCTEAS